MKNNQRGNNYFLNVCRALRNYNIKNAIKNKTKNNQAFKCTFTIVVTSNYANFHTSNFSFPVSFHRVKQKEASEWQIFFMLFSHLARCWRFRKLRPIPKLVSHMKAYEHHYRVTSSRKKFSIFRKTKIN